MKGSHDRVLWPHWLFHNSFLCMLSANIQSSSFNPDLKYKQKNVRIINQLKCYLIVIMNSFLCMCIHVISPIQSALTPVFLFLFQHWLDPNKPIVKQMKCKFSNPERVSATYSIIHMCENGWISLSDLVMGLLTHPKIQNPNTISCVTLLQEVL